MKSLSLIHKSIRKQNTVYRNIIKTVQEKYYFLNMCNLFRYAQFLQAQSHISSNKCYSVDMITPCNYLLSSYAYCVAGKFGGRIDSFRAFGERKFGELLDQPIDY